METVLHFRPEFKVRSEQPPFKKATALYKILFGIMKEWGLTQGELALLLNRPKSTISDWKKKEEVPWSGKMTNDEIQLVEFLGLYADLTNLFAEKHARTSWLREPNEGFGNKSPLALIDENPRMLTELRRLLSKLSNP